MTLPMIELEDVAKSFDGGATYAVEGVSLVIDEGGFVALVGGSGSGKTTTLKMINGLIQADRGQIRVGGEAVGDVAPHLLRRRIGYVFQEVGLFPHLSIAENIGITPKLMGEPTAAIEARVVELLDLVSLPRDSWINIPGHGMNKINAAFGLGGPKLMVQTVAAATGLTINDYIEVNFLGFVKVIDALGGVNICLPFAVNDADSGLDLSAGVHHVNGITALEFARDRHSFAASDLARIDDQQQLMATILSKAVSTGTLSNPFKLRQVISSVTSAIKVDQGFNLVSLASQLSGLRPRNVAFTTVPLGNVNYQTPTGESAVLWDSSAASQLFGQIRADQPPSAVAPPPRSRTGHAKSGARARSKPAPSPSAGVAGGQEKTAAQDTCR